MSFIFAGLGNPGEDYTNTRHNAGRMMLLFLADRLGVDFKADKKLSADTAQITIGGKKATLVIPNTFMNNSGKSVKPLVTSVKKAESLVVIYDELDLPFGTIKISFNKSSGGHRGVESIIGQLKTEGFVRIRIGISPTTAGGKIKKPKGEEAVHKFILGTFKPDEIVALKKISKTVEEILTSFVTVGLEKTMTKFN